MEEKSIEKIAALNIIKNISTTIFPLITFAYVSRILNPIGLGKVTFARTFISYFSMIAGMGIGIYGVRECAKNRMDKRLLSKTAQELFAINLMALLVSYALLFAATFGIGMLRPRSKEILLMSLIMIGQTAAIEWLYSALEEYQYITVRTIVVHTVSLLLVIVGVRNSEDIFNYVLVLVSIEIVIGLVNFVHARKYVTLKNQSHYNLRQHIKPMLYYFAAGASANLFTNSDSIMLGFLSNDYEIGLYTAGTKMCTMVFSVVASFAISIMPRLSFYYESKKSKDYDALVNRTFDYLMMLTIPAAVGLMMLSQNIVVIISGEDYAASGSISQIMAPGIIAYALVVFVHYEIMGPQNDEKNVMRTTIIAAVINIVLNFLFIQIMNAKGAALATVLSKFVFAVVCLVKVRKKINGTKLLHRVGQYLLASLAIIPICLIVKMVITNSVMMLVGSVLLSVVVYFGVLWLMKNEYIRAVIEKVKRIEDFHDLC